MSMTRTRGGGSNFGVISVRMYGPEFFKANHNHIHVLGLVNNDLLIYLIE